MVRVTKFRRPNGYWYIRFWVGGQPADESAKTKSETEAETYRVRREIELGCGIQPLRHAEVSKLVNDYLASLPPRTSAGHRREAKRTLACFLLLCGRRKRDGTSELHSERITPELVDRYTNRRQIHQLYDGQARDRRGRRIVRIRPVSNVTLRKEFRYLSTFFNWCCRQRPPYLRENPIRLSNATSIKSDAKPHFMITDVELRALLKACDTPRQYLFLLLGWWTGGRRSEILALHYYHFDFAACTVDITHGKNNMYGRLPVSRQIMDLVESMYRGADEAAPLFPEDPLPSHGFATLCRKAGVRHHRFHDFRISASMKIKCGGFDAGLASLWVGNQATTNRAHYTDLTAVATRIGSLLEVSDLPPVPSQTA